jgi:hypothetical protein
LTFVSKFLGYVDQHDMEEVFESNHN